MLFRDLTTPSKQLSGSGAQETRDPDFAPEADDRGGVPIRLKIGVDTREIQALDGPAPPPLGVDNPGFSGEAANSTLSGVEHPSLN